MTGWEHSLEKCLPVGKAYLPYGGCSNNIFDLWWKRKMVEANLVTAGSKQSKTSRVYDVDILEIIAIRFERSLSNLCVESNSFVAIRAIEFNQRRLFNFFQQKHEN